MRKFVEYKFNIAFKGLNSRESSFSFAIYTHRAQIQTGIESDEYYGVVCWKKCSGKWINVTVKCHGYTEMNQTKKTCNDNLVEKIDLKF